MEDLRTETLDATEARHSRRIGLISLGLVCGSLLVATAMAITSSGSDDAGSKPADCQRAERSLAAAKTSQHAKNETLLLCSSESSLIQRIF